MGVVGLTSLIEENDHLLEPFELKNSKLIIDGSSLYHQLYRHFHLDCRFGGDYRRFDVILSKFFETLKRCNVNAIVVIDGKANINLKLRTALGRMRSRIAIARDVAKNSDSTGHVLPFLIKEQFIRRMQDFDNVQCLLCFEESDAIIAGLATYYSCPVLSQDSDFLIFNLKGGYIPISSMNFHFDDTKLTHMACNIYFLSNFLCSFPGVEPSLLPLFATLMGNDYSKESQFSEFFSQMSQPHIRSKLQITKKHCRMIGLLNWLDGKDKESAIEALLQKFKADKRYKIRSTIENVLKVYDVAENGLDFESARDFTIQQLKEFGLPDWVQNAYVNGIFTAELLNVFCDGSCLLPPLVEDFTRVSVYECAYPIRKRCFEILLTPFDTRSEFPGDITVYEYGRHEYGIRKRPTTVSAHNVVGPKLAEISSLTVDDKRNVFRELLHMDSEKLDKLLDKRLQLFAVVFTYWVTHCEVCFPQIIAAAYVSILEQLKLENLLKTFENVQLISRRRNFAVENVHAYNQLQAIYRSFAMLNDLLGQPLHVTIPALVFNGRLFYSLVQRFSSSNLCNWIKIATEIFNANGFADAQLIPDAQAFLDLIPEDQMSRLKKVTRDSVTKKKRDNNKKAKYNNSSLANDSENDFDGSNSDLRYESVVPLDNKFGFLSVLPE